MMGFFTYQTKLGSGMRRHWKLVKHDVKQCVVPFLRPCFFFRAALSYVFHKSFDENIARYACVGFTENGVPFYLRYICSKRTNGAWTYVPE